MSEYARAVAPLHHFSADSETIVLRDGVEIRQPDLVQSKALSRWLWETTGTHEEALEPWNWMIDLRVPKHEVSEFGWGYDKVDRVVSALRLTHAGRVGYGYYMEIENSPPDDSLGTPISWSTVFPDFSGEVYMLLDVQEEQLRTVFRRLEGIAEVAFERALSRFNSIYERRSNADRLIDCWVALEALFLGDLMIGSVSDHVVRHSRAALVGRRLVS